LARRPFLLRSCLCIAAIAAGSLLLPAAAGSRAIEDRSTLRAANSLEKPLLAAINRARRERGLRPLRLSSELARAADAHAREMGQGGFFAHESSDGTSPSARIRRYYGGSTVGEALLWRSPGVSPDEAVELWLASRPHRKILLSGALRDAGIGAIHVTDAPGDYRGLDVTIVVADFGAPS
jgi:uncharacterized protein YkwD